MSRIYRSCVIFLSMSVGLFACVTTAPISTITPSTLPTETFSPTTNPPTETPIVPTNPPFTDTLRFTPTSSDTPTITPTITDTSTPQPTLNPLTADHFSGIYGVGIDIAPGRWEVREPNLLLGSPDCYWARYNAVSNVIEDGYGQSPPFVITIVSSDVLVEFDRCGKVVYLGP